MVINPTYLAQRTRSCTYQFLAGSSPVLLTHTSGDMGRREEESCRVIPTMATISTLSVDGLYDHGGVSKEEY
jgi:hypothetical protein